jgi:hypothetical protein
MTGASALRPPACASTIYRPGASLPARTPSLEIEQAGKRFLAGHQQIFGSAGNQAPLHL